jgi:hypothetical protein
MKSEANTSFWKVPVCLGCFVASWKWTEFEGEVVVTDTTNDIVNGNENE